MTFKEYASKKDKKEKNISSKPKAVVAMVDALKSVFNDYDLASRRKAWEAITSSKGKEEMNTLIRNPKSYISDSIFIKLVNK